MIDKNTYTHIPTCTHTHTTYLWTPSRSFSSPTHLCFTHTTLDPITSNLLRHNDTTMRTLHSLSLFYHVLKDEKLITITYYHASVYDSHVSYLEHFLCLSRSNIISSLYLQIILILFTVHILMLGFT